MSHFRPTRRQLLLRRPFSKSRSPDTTNQSIYALIDEYEEDSAPPPSPTMQLQRRNIDDVPIVEVHDSSDEEVTHADDSKKKARTEEGQGSGVKVKQTHLQCGICFNPTTEGGDHHPHVIRCGHIFGRECIEPWIEAKMPSPCPNYNQFSEDGLLIRLYITSARDDLLEEAMAKADGVDELIEKHNAEKKKLIGLNLKLFKIIKGYVETLAMGCFGMPNF